MYNVYCTGCSMENTMKAYKHHCKLENDLFEDYEMEKPCFPKCKAKTISIGISMDLCG